MNRSQLTDVYEKKVLPALFARLDWAFPEFQWTRTASGWTGIHKPENGYRNPAGSSTIVCNQPWGYVDQHGVASEVARTDTDRSAGDCFLQMQIAIVNGNAKHEPV